MANAQQDTNASEVENAGTSAQRLAKVYAEALLNAAEKAGKAEALEPELEGLRTLLGERADLAALIGSKGLKKSQRLPILDSAFQGKVDPLIFDFIQVLNGKERLDLLADTAREFRNLRDERAKRTRVVVRSAVPLSDAQRNNLQVMLEQSLQLTTIIEARVEPGLLGGLVVQVGDEVYDNSVRTRIDTLRNQLLSRSSYEIQVGRDRFSSAS
jgi:F-type H+-transporting ATPase subunit delta